MTLAIVPARGGSRRVPRKALRDCGGDPLIGRTIQTLKDVGQVQDVVVSTDDDEIAAVSRQYGASVDMRPPELANDDVPVEEVARHVAKGQRGVETFLLAQPTTPLVSSETYTAALNSLAGDEFVGKLTATSPVTRLYYIDGSTEGATDYDVQVGAGFYVYRREWFLEPQDEDLCKETFTIPVREFCDIDTFRDLAQAREKLEKKHVVFRITANRKVGAGHLHRCLVLATELSHHDVTFLMRDCDDWAWQKVEDAGFLALWESSKAYVPVDLLVNDCLDTSVEDVLPFLQGCSNVVCLEDFGKGSDYADLVIQELYRDGRKNAVCGPEWAVLRPEFRYVGGRGIRKTPEKVLVTFGGTDPANLRPRIERLFPFSQWDVRFRFLGRQGVQARSMAEEMLDADLVICSAGRTVHEAARVGTPVISISANAREETHTHCPGVIRLGLHATVSDEGIQGAVENVLSSYELRQEMSRMGQRAVDGKGCERIVHRVEGLLRGL